MKKRTLATLALGGLLTIGSSLSNAVAQDKLLPHYGLCKGVIVYMHPHENGVFVGIDTNLDGKADVMCDYIIYSSNAEGGFYVTPSSEVGIDLNGNEVIDDDEVFDLTRPNESKETKPKIPPEDYTKPGTKI